MFFFLPLAGDSMYDVIFSIQDKFNRIFLEIVFR